MHQEARPDDREQVIFPAKTPFALSFMGGLPRYRDPSLLVDWTGGGSTV